jgi:hypothetical protein
MLSVTGAFLSPGAQMRAAQISSPRMQL